MNDLWFRPAPRKRIKEIPLAPVLDLLTVVIFFLLLSASFVELTKQTLPPSSLSQISDPNAPAPLNLKIFFMHKGGAYNFSSLWNGEKPGREERAILSAREDFSGHTRDIREAAALIAQSLKMRFPAESSIQVGLGHDINYQDVIAVMDGVREHFEDLVLVSPEEAEAKVVAQ